MMQIVRYKMRIRTKTPKYIPPTGYTNSPIVATTNQSVRSGALQLIVSCALRNDPSSNESQTKTCVRSGAYN